MPKARSPWPRPSGAAGKGLALAGADGGDRAGLHSWDRLDHHGEPSADRIVPERQSLQQGQRLNSEPSGQNWMTVAVVEPNRTLVMRSNFELPSGHSFDPRTGPRSRVYPDGIWGFYLRQAPSGKTRLVAHTRGKSRPRPFMGAFDLLLGEPMHFIMQTRQFHKHREHLTDPGPGGSAPGLPVRGRAPEVVPGPYGERQGAGRQRASGPWPGVSDVRPLAECQRRDAEVQGGDLAAGAAAEYDGGSARSEPGHVDAERVGVAVVGVRRSPRRTAGTGRCPRMMSWRWRTVTTRPPSILGWGR